MKRCCALPWLVCGTAVAQAYPACDTVRLPVPFAAQQVTDELVRFYREQTETWARAVRAAFI